MSMYVNDVRVLYYYNNIEITRLIAKRSGKTFRVKKYTYLHHF